MNQLLKHFPKYVTKPNSGLDFFHSPKEYILYNYYMQYT